MKLYERLKSFLTAPRQLSALKAERDQLRAILQATAAERDDAERRLANLERSFCELTTHFNRFRGLVQTAIEAAVEVARSETGLPVAKRLDGALAHLSSSQLSE